MITSCDEGILYSEGIRMKDMINSWGGVRESFQEVMLELDLRSKSVLGDWNLEGE